MAPRSEPAHPDEIRNQKLASGGFAPAYQTGSASFAANAQAPAHPAGADAHICGRQALPALQPLHWKRNFGKEGRSATRRPQRVFVTPEQFRWLMNDPLTP